MVLTRSISAGAEGQLHVALEYDTATAVGCPSELDFRQAVAGQFDYDPFVSEAARTVSVQITRGGGALRGLLQWRDPHGTLQGERRFDSLDADCHRLAQNMAFAVTVQIQLLNASSPDSSAAGRGEPTKAESHTVLAARAPPSPPAPPSSPHLELGAGAGLFAASGWFPTPAAGGNARFVARSRAFAAELAVEMTLPTRYERQDGSGFRSSAVAASLASCVRLQSVEACPVFRFGQIRARGFGVDEPKSPTGAFSQAGFRLSLSQAIGPRLEGVLQIQGLYTLSPWAIQLNGIDAFTSPHFSFLVGIDLVTLFL